MRVFSAIIGAAALLMLLILMLARRDDSPGAERIEEPHAEMTQPSRAAQPAPPTPEAPEAPAAPTPGEDEDRPASPPDDVDGVDHEPRRPAAGAELDVPVKRPRARKPPSDEATSPGEKPDEAPAPVSDEAVFARKARNRGREIGPAQIRAVVADHGSELSTCYREQDRPRVNKIEVKLEVAPNGEVTQATVPKQAPGDLIAACITRRAKTWKFPAPGGEETQEVIVPFVLVPAEQEPLASGSG